MSHKNTGLKAIKHMQRSAADLSRDVLAAPASVSSYEPCSADSEGTILVSSTLTGSYTLPAFSSARFFDP